MFCGKFKKYLIFGFPFVSPICCIVAHETCTSCQLIIKYLSYFCIIPVPIFTFFFTFCCCVTKNASFSTFLLCKNVNIYNRRNLHGILYTNIYSVKKNCQANIFRHLHYNTMIDINERALYANCFVLFIHNPFQTVIFLLLLCIPFFFLFS